LLEGGLGERLDSLGVLDDAAALLGASGSSSLPSWAAEVISSTIDADLLDYLRRDSYFAGLAHDYDDRVFRYFTVIDGHLALNMTKHGMERPDASSEVIQLLRMRYFLTERVYYHHTKVVAGAMISKAVELALDAGELAEPDFLELNDWTLLERLRTPRLPAARSLIGRLLRRDLLKRGYVVSARSVAYDDRAALVERYHDSRAGRREAEVALAKAIGGKAEEVIVYCPALTVMKEAGAWVRVPSGLGRLNEGTGSALAEIQALEERYAGLWRLYVFAPRETVERLTVASQELFGFPSEHIGGTKEKA
jgi:HD superfamily phosphohydrolase